MNNRRPLVVTSVLILLFAGWILRDGQERDPETQRQSPPLQFFASTFGADATGKKDSTDALQKALNAAGAAAASTDNQAEVVLDAPGGGAYAYTGELLIPHNVLIVGPPAQHITVILKAFQSSARR